MNLQKDNTNKNIILATIIIMACILVFAFLKGTSSEDIFALFIFMCMFMLPFTCILRFAKKTRTGGNEIIKPTRYFALNFFTGILFTVMCIIIYGIIW